MKDNLVTLVPETIHRQSGSMIKDMTLAPSGYRKIEWASRHMAVPSATGVPEYEASQGFEDRPVSPPRG